MPRASLIRALTAFLTLNEPIVLNVKLLESGRFPYVLLLITNSYRIIDES